MNCVEGVCPPRPWCSSRRFSLSAGTITPSSGYVSSVYAKSVEERAAICDAFAGNVIFEGIDGKLLSSIVDAAFRVNVAAGETVIRHGEEGENFYIVVSGRLDVFVRGSSNDDVLVESIGPSDYFGDLALLYQSTRSVSVLAVDECELWAVDRNTFSMLLSCTAFAKRTQCMKFLSMCPLFDSLKPYELARLCDASESETFEKGDVVVERGTTGNYFYIVEEGSFAALKPLSSTESSSAVVLELESGDYFGEIVLLGVENVRQATVVATSKSSVLKFNRDAFKRSFGPLEEILKRNTRLYETFEKVLRTAGPEEGLAAVRQIKQAARPALCPQRHFSPAASNGARHIERALSL